MHKFSRRDDGILADGTVPGASLRQALGPQGSKAVMNTGFGPPAWASHQHSSGGGDLEGTAEVRAEARAVATGALPAAQGRCPHWWPPMV